MRGKKQAVSNLKTYDDKFPDWKKKAGKKKNEPGKETDGNVNTKVNKRDIRTTLTQSRGLLNTNRKIFRQREAPQASQRATRQNAETMLQWDVILSGNTCQTSAWSWVLAVYWALSACICVALSIYLHICGNTDDRIVVMIILIASIYGAHYTVSVAYLNVQKDLMKPVQWFACLYTWWSWVTEELA